MIEYIAQAGDTRDYRCYNMSQKKGSRWINSTGQTAIVKGSELLAFWDETLPLDCLEEGC